MHRHLGIKEAYSIMKKTIPTVAQLSLVDGGSSYAIKLFDGSFILLDGGLAGDDYDYNVAGLWRYLSENTPEGEKPVIADWIITHFHSDHVDLAARFLIEYKKQNNGQIIPLQSPRPHRCGAL